MTTQHDKTFLDVAETKKKLMNKIHQDLSAIKQEYINNKVGYYCSIISPVGHLVNKRTLSIVETSALTTIFSDYSFTEGVVLSLLKVDQTDVVVQVKDSNIHHTHSEVYNISRRVQPIASTNASVLQFVSAGKYCNSRNYYSPNDIELMLSIATQELAEQAIVALAAREQNGVATYPETEAGTRLAEVVRFITSVEQVKHNSTTFEDTYNDEVQQDA